MLCEWNLSKRDEKCIVIKPERIHLKYTGVDGRIILKWIINMCAVELRIYLAQEEVQFQNSCKHSNEPSHFIKFRN
jgi:hypothetical protein